MFHKVKFTLIYVLIIISTLFLAKRGGLTSTLGPRLVFNRNGAEDIKRSLRSTKNIDPRTLRSLEKAVDKSLKAELKEGEDFAILYLDANNL